MKYDGIIFDLDGTLWDSTETVAASWSASMQAMGVERRFTAEEIAGIMGCTDVEIEERLFSDFGRDSRHLCSTCMSEEPGYVAVHGGRLYEGVEEMLRALSAERPLFIVSNCQSGYVEAFLEYSGLGCFFADYEYLGRCGLSKRENIRLVMERNGLKSCVYVGDTAHDGDSAHGAGCDFVHAAYGFGRADAAEAVAHNPAELPAILNSL